MLYKLLFDKNKKSYYIAMSRSLLQQNHSSGTASVDKLNVHSRIMVGGPIVPQTGKGDVVRVESQLWVGADMAAVAKTSDYNDHTTWSYTPIAPLTWSPVPSTVSHALDLLKAGSGGGALTLTNGNIFVGNPANVPTDVSLTGDALISNTGVLNIKQISGTAMGGTGMNITSTSGLNGSAYFGFNDGIPPGLRSVGIGYQASNISTGADNVTIGSEAGKLNIISNRSTILGSKASNERMDGADNTFVGYNSGTATDTFGPGLFNPASERMVCIGAQAAIVSSPLRDCSRSIVIGYRSQSSGFANVVMGYEARTSSIGDNGIAIGNGAIAGASNVVAIGTGCATGREETVAIGTSAGTLGTAPGGIYIGKSARSQAFTAVDSIIIGRESSAGTGENTIHIGANSGVDNNNDSGPHNVSVGGSSMNASGGCAQNSLVGGRTGLTLYSGSNNAVLGYNSFSSATGNDRNVAIGSESLVNAVSTTYSVGTIQISSGNIVTGVGTTFTPAMVGGYIVANTFTYKIVAFGGPVTLTISRFHGFDAIPGSTYVIHYNAWHNTAVGYEAGSALIDGNDNTLIGYQANVDNGARTGVVALGQGVVANVDGGFFVKHNTGGAGNNASFVAGQLVETVSSRQFKDDIRTLEDTSDRIDRVRPVRYRYKEGHGDTSKENIGLIAEEMEELFPEFVVYDEDNLPRGLVYDQMVAVLFKEVQRLRQKERDTDAKIAEIMERLN